MNMSMDKPTTLNSTEGTTGPQVKKCKNDVKKDVPGHGNENMNMSMDKPMALHRTESTRGPPLKNVKLRSQNMSPKLVNKNMMSLDRNVFQHE